LPLLPQMPVIIGENLDVKGGIVNGSQGIVKHMHYIQDPDGYRFATSAVVSIPDSSPDPFTLLPPHDCMVLPKTINIK
ncbi:uncharacterized protein EI90DRAFT_2849708, partial [Cantharellus anzutake]|uniref:uncharacterized protein n=1 Tax=Cantharellus anzutake TaxID=1750568 RepID=UPI0019045F96